MLARHRLASARALAGGSHGAERLLYACWLGTGWPRQAADLRGCKLAGRHRLASAGGKAERL